MLSDEQKRYIAKNLVSKFNRTDEEVNATIDMIEDILEGRNELLLYELQYRLFISEDFEYGRKLSKFIFEIFTYLYDTTKPEYKEVIFNATTHLFDALFIEKFKHDNRIEKQSSAALNVLKNVSKHLNMIIHTQERMIASLSHEMRTSLNAIMGYLKILEGSNSLNTEESSHLMKALQATETLKQLIKDILDITKLNSGQMEISRDWFLADEMMLECVEQIGIDIKGKKGVEFKYYPSFMPYYIYSDKVHIMEILINFLTNAYKYTDSGFIEFKMEYRYNLDGIRVIFSVADSGLGMDEEQQKHIFTAYNRYHKEREGLGLGMYIAKRLSEKIGGDIKIKSKKGEGSTFALDILFRDSKPYIPNFKNKKLFFLIKNSNPNSYLARKLDYLKKSGVYIKVFKRESSLINYLLEDSSIIPDLVSFYYEGSNFAKFDALVYFLKNDNRYKDTIFIAENISDNISLKYFDKISRFDFPISRYEQFLIKKERVDRFKDISSKEAMRILVVDDIETNLEIFKMLVRKSMPFIDIDTAMGGYEALGMCKVRRYDIIFLDLKMPGLDGFELLKKMKKECKNLPPVYAFSADVYKETFSRLKEEGFEGIVEKPLEIDKIYQIFKRHMR